MIYFLKYYLVALLLLLLIPLFVFPQISLNGIVLDITSGKPLSGAHISLSDTKKGVISDTNGKFFLKKISTGKHKLKISYIGYSDTFINIWVDDKTAAFYKIYMNPAVKQMPLVFVTANRATRIAEEVPARIAVIQNDEVKDFPANNCDDLLKLIPGVYDDRSEGIFSKNASISMHGLNADYRVLVLEDGVPINKTDGGSNNWNRIITDNVDKIEIIKGPASSLYGGNAMGGVINIISPRPQKIFEGEIKGLIGTYNTIGGNARLGGNLTKNDEGFYWNVLGYYKKGDGYIIAPDSTRNFTNIKTYMWEYDVDGKVGYQFNKNNYAEVDYSYYNDKVSEGVRVYEPDGTYDQYTTDFLRATYNGEIKKFNLTLNMFYQDENYQKQTETISLKKNSKYTLYLTDAIRLDEGAWLNCSRNILPDHEIMFGFDFKQGSVNSSDIYLTSSDILTNKGMMDFYAPFVQYEISALDKKLKLIAGLRYDIVRFSQGSFTISDPSSLTSFMADYPDKFRDTTWQAISPKLALKYFFNNNLNVYISYGRGFRAPILDDMCKNGNVTKGFKMANPELKPEILDNYELGSNISLWHKLTIETSFYCSIGKDFQYFVYTGDSVYTGGDNLKPVMKRENISNVRILGAEISLNYTLNKYLLFYANYSYNDSRITSFYLKDYPSINLTGKYLMEVPPNLASAGVYLKTNIVNTFLSFNFVDKRWWDDQNTIQTPSYYTFDLKLLKQFVKKYTVSLSAQDLLNHRFIDNKGNLSPGRFFMLGLAYKI